ncbi:unnamed protein product [Peronospora destructor]|uniref:Helicase ATP-binding domain-containing protein n=1 Tax=Peronospora destructor TaxID=86335 RepID=A0AAV0USG2_9STRA|nr:unnamed protein product [Peronospora destructor]
MLQEGGNMSIDELRARYAGVLAVNDEALAVFEGGNAKKVEEENDGEDVVDGESDPTKCDEEDQADDETTIEGEERLGRDTSLVSRAEELRLLEEESNMSIAQLRARCATVSDDKNSSSDKTGVQDQMRNTTALRRHLREYQKDGVNGLVSMCERRINGILADEMGLGKTIQTLSLMAHLASFKVLTYQLVVQDAHCFKRKKWYYLILDEAHNVKNWKSLRWQTLLTFSSQRRFLLTGTPLQNNLLELYALMHFLMPHVFASCKESSYWF